MKTTPQSLAQLIEELQTIHNFRISREFDPEECKTDAKWFWENGYKLLSICKGALKLREETEEISIQCRKYPGLSYRIEKALSEFDSLFDDE